LANGVEFVGYSGGMAGLIMNPPECLDCMVKYVEKIQDTIQAYGCHSYCQNPLLATNYQQVQQCKACMLSNKIPDGTYPSNFDSIRTGGYGDPTNCGEW
jgi:hypothetical protein